MANELTLEMESGVSSQTREGFVKLTWGEMAGQLTPADCENLARDLMFTAATARLDEAAFRFATEELDLAVDSAARLLAGLRAAREAKGGDDVSTEATAAEENPQGG